MFFGFLGCREACPIGLDKLTPMLAALGPDAANVQPVFVDVSMDKEDLKGLAQWVSNFHPSLVGLTGTRAERFEIVRLFKVWVCPLPINQLNENKGRISSDTFPEVARSCGLPQCTKLAAD